MNKNMVFLNPVKPPCYGCPQRHPMCHSECEKYMKFKQEVNQTTKRIKLERSLEKLAIGRDKIMYTRKL